MMPWCRRATWHLQSLPLLPPLAEVTADYTLSCLDTQQWTALRAQGVQTPQIAAWQRLPDLPATYANTNAASVLYSYVLNVYSAPSFQDVRRPSYMSLFV